MVNDFTWVNHMGISYIDYVITNRLGFLLRCNRCTLPIKATNHLAFRIILQVRGSRKCEPKKPIGWNPEDIARYLKDVRNGVNEGMTLPMFGDVFRLAAAAQQSASVLTLIPSSPTHCLGNRQSGSSSHLCQTL